MAKISKIEVPYEGPEEGYNILCVGEAPGQWENRLKRPFVSRAVAKEHGLTMDRDTAGDLLERYLGRLGVPRSEVKLANLCNYQPPYNNFRAVLKSRQLQEGLEKLKAEIRRVQPNVIIALGGWPMWFLTGKAKRERGKLVPGQGILSHRGSRYRALKDITGGGHKQKVFCTMHPAYVLRMWKMNPVFHIDLQHAIEDSHFPELRYPKYEEHIDPPKDILYDLAHEAVDSDWISIDIETFPSKRYSCIGYSFRRGEKDIGICLTCLREDVTNRVGRELWESKTPKIFQYGTYDIGFMKNFYGWKIGGYYDGIGWDTYVASASIYPDYPRKLDFLTSIYTRFPFYKHERKVWKETMDLNRLWRYNIKDIVATSHVALGQSKDIEEIFGVETTIFKEAA